MHRAARFVGGGCGECGIAQESPDLAGNWQDPGGLLGATAAEEAETEEKIKSGAGRLHHQDAAGNISNGEVGGSHSTFGAATQLQQIAQHQQQPTVAAGPVRKAPSNLCSIWVSHSTAIYFFCNYS